MNPFRFEPTATRTDRAVLRSRITRLLAGRFERRLTTITAAAGFGKTTVLAQAMDDNRLSAEGRDLYLGATPNDADPDHFLAGIAACLDIEAGASAESLERVIAAVWSAAPEQTVLIVDDAHHLRDSPAEAVLTGLLRDLPANGHLVLSSRRPVGVAMGRLRALGQVIEIGEDDLLLDTDEMAELRRRRAVSNAALTLPRHAATADLLIAAGPEAGADFLWEEILTTIGTERLNSLQRCAVLESLDDDVVVPFTDGRFTTDQLLAGVPLVAGEPGGTRQMHALLREALAARLEPGERRKACAVAADVERANERYHTALPLYLEAGDRLAARATAREFLMLPLLRQNVESVSAIRRHMHDWDPDSAASAALDATATFGGSEDQMLERFRRCARLARDEGDVELEALALYRIVQIEVVDNELPAPDIVDRLTELACSSPFAAGASAYAASWHAQVHGDVDTALAQLDHLHPMGTANVVNLTAERLCDLGRPESVGAGLTPDDLAALPPGAEVFIAYAMWLRGEVPPEFAHQFVTGMTASVLRRGYAVTSVSVLSVAAVIALASGDGPGARRCVEHAEDLLRVRLPATLRLTACAAAAAVASYDGDDDRAARLLDPARCDLVLGRWPLRGHFIALPLLYLVRPELRPLLDRADVGPSLRTAIDAGRALVAVRDADPSDPDEVAAAASLAAALPWNDTNLLRAHVLPHHLTELAVAAEHGGSVAAPALLATIPDKGTMLRRVASVPSGPFAHLAHGLLDGTFKEPPHQLSLRVFGATELCRDGEAVVDDDWQRRALVRSLMALLVERRTVQRQEVVELLWPGHSDEGKALATLRTTLSTLQRVIEPDRPRHASPYFITTSQDQLVLDESVTSEADVFDTLMTAAQDDDAAGLPGRAIESYRRALDVYRGDYLADVDAPWAVFTRLRLRSLAVGAACRVAELVAARGEPEESARLAQRALQIDPYSERAGRLLATALHASGDVRAAREAALEVLHRLRQLEVDPAHETLRLVDRLGVPHS
jgi:LuxR family transcriptional regulator, maltose regulon positive regulatory protein